MWRRRSIPNSLRRRHSTEWHRIGALLPPRRAGGRSGAYFDAGYALASDIIEVEDREATMKKITDNGGVIFSDREERALKFRAPDGTLVEIVIRGSFTKAAQKSA
jgi:hypothetical protein